MCWRRIREGSGVFARRGSSGGGGMGGAWWGRGGDGGGGGEGVGVSAPGGEGGWVVEEVCGVWCLRCGRGWLGKVRG